MDERDGLPCSCETRPEQPVMVRAAQRAASMVNRDIGISCDVVDARWPVSSTVESCYCERTDKFVDRPLLKLRRRAAVLPLSLLFDLQLFSEPADRRIELWLTWYDIMPIWNATRTVSKVL